MRSKMTFKSYLLTFTSELVNLLVTKTTVTLERALDVGTGLLTVTVFEIAFIYI